MTLRKIINMPHEQERAEHIITIARQWLGTPYHHQQSLKGCGCDCLGLIRGIYSELYNHPPALHTPYTRDWAEASGEETLIKAAGAHLKQIDINQHAPGDVLIFRFRKWMVAKHAAIESYEGRMIHAIEQSSVSEVSLSPWWQRHIAAVFRFPERPADL